MRNFNTHLTAFLFFLTFSCFVIQVDGGQHRIWCDVGEDTIFDGMDNAQMLDFISLNATKSKSLVTSKWNKNQACITHIKSRYEYVQLPVPMLQPNI